MRQAGLLHTLFKATHKLWSPVASLSDSLTPYPFQEEAIGRLLEPGRRGLLLADEMGLGKTVSVISAINRDPSIGRVLIVAPKSVLPAWRLELSRWLTRPVSIGLASASAGMPDEMPDVLLLNYELVRKHRAELDALLWDALVCDEAHFLKNPDAQRTQALLGHTCKANCPGALRARRVWFLTGSPLLNNPIELFPLLRTLDPRCQTLPALSSIAAFRDRYCGRQDGPWGTTFKGARNSAELRAKLRGERAPPLMLRRTKAQVLIDLPPKRHSLLPIDDEAVARSERETLERLWRAARGGGGGGGARGGSEGLVEGLSCLKVVELKQRLRQAQLSTSGKKAQLRERLERHLSGGAAGNSPPPPPAAASGALEGAGADGGRTGLMAAELESAIAAWNAAPQRGEGSWGVKDGVSGDRLLGVLAKARHETALRKVPHALEHLESATAAHKVVVFAHHRDVQEKICKEFGASAVAVHGDMALEERSEAVRRFQEEEGVRVFVGSIRAAGVGITLSAASHVIFVEFDWSPMIMEQAEDRCHRIGQRDSVLVQYLFFEGTVDEQMARTLAAKLAACRAVIDGGQPCASTAYVFDFGKHAGCLLIDVAADDPGYLKFLVNEGVYEQRPELRDGLAELGLLPSGAQAGEPPEESEEERQAGSFVLAFGKHSGKPLREVPRGYLRWMASEGVATDRGGGLDDALRCLGYDVAESRPVDDDDIPF